MTKKNDKYPCALCGKAFPLRSLIPDGAVREAVAREIARDYPAWSAERFICRPDLAKYQAKYVHSLLESEKGEISTLEQEVVHSIQDHELLAKDVDSEYERTWTFGEKLTDRITEFGGSWTFLIFLAIFLVFWIAMNTTVLFAHPPDPYPFIFLNLILSCVAAFRRRSS